MSEVHKVAEVDIAASREEVWQALRDPVEIRRWFGWETPDIEAEIKLIFVDGAEPDEAAGVIQFGEWEGVADRFELGERDGRTVLSVIRAGTPPQGGWEATPNEVIEGWTSFIQQLRLYLERHRGAARRTLWLASKSGPRAIAALGLGDLRRPGERYARAAGPGETISGEVWFRAPWQVGVVVSEWGGGLLIVGDRAAGGTALLTVYGLSDADFAALEARWTDWWHATYP